ncbi:M99 family carboxypeptidase catalytic domain-containing protein [Caminibacter sp.]
MRLLILFFAVFLFAKVEFKTYTIKSTNSPKAFIIAGIHGNERGSFYAAWYLVKNLKIKKGTVKIIPFVNVPAIKKYKRYEKFDINSYFGYSDKFIKKSALTHYETETVLYIKNLVRKFKPELILSLHQGRNYSYVNKKYWGNSITIDEKIYKSKNLYKIAKEMLNKVNKSPYLKYPFTVKILNTFSKKHIQNYYDFSAWALKTGAWEFTLESSTYSPLENEIYNLTLLTTSLLEKFGIKTNQKELLNIKKIRKFIEKNKELYFTR